MKKLLLLLLISFSSMAFSQGQFASFLNYVNSLPQANRGTAVDDFINYARLRGIPLIDNDTAAFFYKGSASSVSVSGDFNDWSLQPMQQIAGTSFYWYQSKFEMNARLDYKFVLNGSNYILDPENPHTCTGGFGPNSELAMPSYIQPWDINYKANIQHGTVTLINIFSKNVNINYQVSVYFPAGYNASIKYPTVYFQDGAEYISLASAVNILDNLIDSNKIDKVIGVFVKPNDRNNEYAGTTRNQYQLFFVNELVPLIDSLYSTNRDPAKRLVLGDSYGANISLLISYNHPDIFGNCGLQSSAFQPNSYEASNLILNGPVKNIKFSTNWGTYMDPYSSLRSFRDNLISKGYSFDWRELPEGHSWGQWRATLKYILENIYPYTLTGINENGSAKPSTFILKQNYPNPFNPSTSIEFVLEKSSTVKLDIFNSLGQKVVTLINEFKEVGQHKILFNASGLPSGVYFYTLILPDQNISRSMVLLK
jgi:enterochelin esterase family protein